MQLNDSTATVRIHKNMKKSISKLYYIIPVIYTVIIFLFLYLQFRGSETIRKDMGNTHILIEKSRGTGFKPVSIKKVNIEYNKLSFSFSKKTLPKLIINNLTSDLSIINYKFLSDGIILKFDRGISMEFIGRGEPENALKVKVTAPLLSDKDNHTVISIPFSINSDYKKVVNNIPAMLWKNGSLSVFLSLPEGSSIDKNRDNILLRYTKIDKKNFIDINTFRSRDNFNPYLTWYSGHLTPIDAELFTGTIKAYTGKAYTGWIKTRLDRQKNGWRNPDKKIFFNEKIVASALSASIGRKEYGTVFKSMLKIIRREIRDRPDKNIPFITSVFYGGLKKYSSNLQKDDSKNIIGIREKVKTLDKSVFDNQNLVTIILDRGPFFLIQELTGFAENIDFSQEDIKTSLNILNYYIEISKNLADNGNYNNRILKIINEKILPDLIPYKDKIFITDNKKQAAGNTININLTFRAGILILEMLNLSIDKLPEKEKYLFMGRKLIASSLSFTDNRGILPLNIRLNTKKQITEKKGYILPEDIYPAIAGLLKFYYPEETPLFKYLEPGTWIWTTAGIKRVSISNKSYVFTLAYPVRQSHFILIQGIKPFKEIIIHGIRWKQDTAYYRYPNGWFYDKYTKTLFIKITQRKQYAQIILNY